MLYPSEIYAHRQWYNESLKQLKAAVKSAPKNETYKERLAESEGLKIKIKAKRKRQKSKWVKDLTTRPNYF